jgi:hypothetical protein
MRYLRGLTVAAALALALVLPGSAPAAISTFQIGTEASLGPEGATVTVPVIVNCDAGQFGFLSVTVSQSTGHRLAQGSGGATVACTGSDQTVAIEVGNFPGVNAYKQGRASASGTLQVVDPSTGQSFEAIAGPQEIRIRR